MLHELVTHILHASGVANLKAFLYFNGTYAELFVPSTPGFPWRTLTIGLLTMELTPKPRRMKQNSITKLSPIYDMMDYSVSESTDKLV